MLWMVLRQPLLNVADGAFERNVEAERRVFVMRTLDHQRHFVGVHRYDRSREDGQAEKLLRDLKLDGEGVKSASTPGVKLTKEQVDEMVENAFLKHVSEKDTDEKPKRGRKPGKDKKGKVFPLFDKAGKESTSEQKGTPLFMNGQLIFFV